MKNKIVKTISMVIVSMAVMCGCSAEKSVENNKDAVQKQEADITEKTAEESVKEVAEENVKETTEATLEKTDESNWKSAYLDVVEEFYDSKKDSTYDWSSLGFELIDFDGDDVPELVTGVRGYSVNLYAYHEGEVVKLIDDWAYGAAGNAGYDYAEGKGVIFNINSDMAGMIEYVNYSKLNKDSYELEDMYDKSLCIWNIEDTNGNGEIDWNDAEELSDDYEFGSNPTYHYGDEEISEEEYKAMQVEGNYKNLYGEKNYEEIVETLSV